MVDAQAALETQFSLWASVLAGATVCLHAAGWMEGGLTNSYEKVIVDVELLQMLAELCAPPEADEDALGYSAIAEVPPGGHFFAAAHTMARYRDAFHEPMIADWSNFGAWTERGSLTATERANAKWKQVLREFAAPPAAAACAPALDEFIARRTAEGGAPPLT